MASPSAIRTHSHRSTCRSTRCALQREVHPRLGRRYRRAYRGRLAAGQPRVGELPRKVFGHWNIRRPRDLRRLRGGGQSKSSDVTWHFVQQIFSAEHQPKEGGATDLSNDRLAELARIVGAPQAAQDLIRLGLPIGFDPHTIAADNLSGAAPVPPSLGCRWSSSTANRWKGTPTGWGWRRAEPTRALAPRGVGLRHRRRSAGSNARREPIRPASATSQIHPF